MENFMRALVLVPLITALIQWIKQILPETFYKFLWLLACGLWVLAAYWYVGAMSIVDLNDAMIIMWWVIAGLAASWLYETAKNTFGLLNR